MDVVKEQDLEQVGGILDVNVLWGCGEYWCWCGGRSHFGSSAQVFARASMSPAFSLAKSHGAQPYELSEPMGKNEDNRETEDPMPAGT